MRKFSKIFATLLTLVIVVGVIAVVSGAKIPKSTTDFDKSDDFESTAAGKNASGFGSGTGSADTYSTKVVVRNEEADNQYLRFAYIKGDAPKAYRRDYEYAPYNATTPKTHIADYSYFTIDFDICADAYTYELDGATYTSREIPEGAENVRLAYSPGTTFSIDNRIFDGSAYKSGYTTLNVKLQYDDVAGVWKVYLGSVDTGFTLANKIDVWNHFTYAIKVIPTEVEANGETKITYGYSEARLYINGEFVSRSDISSSNKDFGYDINPRAIDWYINDLATPYSMGIDNFTPTFYEADYTSGSEYGIDDLFDEPDTSKLLFFCSDVVYDKNYNAPGNPYISIDMGSNKYYMEYFLNDVLAELQTGDMIETGFDIYNFTPNEKVKNFEVYLINGAEFTLSAEALEKYDIVKSALGYKVTQKKAPEGLKINILDSKGGTLIGTTTLYEGKLPTIAVDSISKISIDDGIISQYKVNDWLWDIDGDENSERDYSEEVIRALDPFEMEIVKEYWNGAIDVYPDADSLAHVEDADKKLEYVILDQNSNIWYSEAYPIEEYLDIATIGSRFEALPMNSTLLLYKDVEINDALKIKENVKLTVLLSGYDVVSTADALFVLYNNSEIYVYSESESFITANKLFATSNGTTKFNNTTIVFGDAEKGNNLLADTDTFAELKTSYAGASDDTPIIVSVDAEIIDGNIIIAAPDIELDIKDTTIGSENTLFKTILDYKQFFDIDAKITVNNSTLVTFDSIVGDMAENTVISISNSIVFGTFDSAKYEQEGSVILGSNVYLSDDYRADETIVSLAENTVAAVANLEAQIVGMYVPITLVTVDEDSIDPDEYALVVWKDAVGGIFKEEYYHNSCSTPNHPSVNEMKDERKFPGVENLDNGWYDRGYRSWKNAEEGKGNEITFGAENVFVPVADGVVPSIDLKLNASLKSTSVGLNLYVPIPSEESGVVIHPNNVFYYDVNGNLITTTVLTDFAAAEGYYAIEIPLALTDFSAKTVEIVFEVNGYEEYPIVLKEVVEIDFLTYAELATELYACGSEDAKVVMQLLNYKKLAAEEAGIRLSAKLSERISNIFAMHTACKCLTNVQSIGFSEAELNASIANNEALNDKIIGAEFVLVGDKVELYFYVDASLDVESFDIKHKGLLNQLGGWDYINYKINVSLEAVDYKKYAGVDCVVYSYSDLALYNASAIMNISLAIASENGEDATVYTGAFSLASYIASLDEDSATFASALYAASNMALEFRFIREGE